MASGVAGEWAITAEFKGVTLYFSSIAPGLFVVLAGTALAIYGPRRVLQLLAGERHREEEDTELMPDLQSSQCRRAKDRQ